MGSHVGLDELHMMEQKFKAIDSLQSLTTFQKDSLYALDKGNEVLFVCGNWVREIHCIPSLCHVS